MNRAGLSLARSIRYSSRPLHTSTRILQQQKRRHGLVNILADDNLPPVEVKSITSQAIHLADGLNLTAPCMFLEGEVFLWDVPQNLWDGWTTEHFQIFDVVDPKPEILLFGTGGRIAHPPPSIRTYLNGLGIQVDTMDTKNACSYYNLLSEEGRRVAAALLPVTPNSWHKTSQK